jgi:predicted helicase
VIEQLSLGSESLAALAVDWRKLLFPDADDEKFADGYAQAVTFGLLMARARDIKLGSGLDHVAKLLGKTNSLIGSALRLLTDDAENQETLKTSLGTLVRVLDSVDWQAISIGRPDAWLYFYEDFLEIYDNKLRKQTGSYYTPPEVVNAMIHLVNEILETRFSLYNGLASPQVTVADPAVGTGTFLLGVLRQIAKIVESSEGPGSVPAAINATIKRLIGFEIQLGPFAVAQLRLLAEVADLTGNVSDTPLQMFVTDTLSNPYVEEEWIPEILGSIAKSRQQANLIKKAQPITVVIGNPPYKEKAMGRGGWVESGSANSPIPAPLSAWMPPANWGISAHAKHLRNLYIYFWRWATWKVFDHHPDAKNGIVCFITAAGFISGSGFEKMRDYLRRTVDEIWVIDCSPEGHRPEVNTRIFQGVQQPVCIVIASCSPKKKPDVPATVRFTALPVAHRKSKLDALSNLHLDNSKWEECSSEWRSPFLPASSGTWSSYPKLDDLFVYNGSGVMPGRTWIIAPDADSLKRRWQALINASNEQKEILFHPHLRNGQVGDKHSQKVVAKPLSGYPPHPKSIAQEQGPCVLPLQYGFRSFDRQWIIPDSRLINQPNPELWELHSENQLYLTAPSDKSPTNGPALTFTGLIPDLHHYNGRGGRVFPLWQDREASSPNMPVELLNHLSIKYERVVSPEDIIAYIAAITAHPAFTARFKLDLITPGLHIPLTANGAIFAEATELGQTIIWLHTFGERFTDASKNRPFGPPRLSSEIAPRIPIDGAISQEIKLMPDILEYDATNQRLIVGNGYVENVSPEVWAYEVSGKQILRQWFSYRKANRERPIIGDRRPPSKLGNIQPDYWLAEYTTELINVLNILAWLVNLEPQQAELLERVCSGSTISVDELRLQGGLLSNANYKSKTKNKGSVEQLSLLD